jgi:hypothetical protein
VGRTSIIISVGAALATIGLAGCGDLDVTLDGPVPTPVVLAPVSTMTTPVVLAFDPLGLLTLNGRAIDLPHAVERRRFGLSVVDAGALPRVWRPSHAAEGGILVGSLPKASPLAIAGLRPFDRLVSVGSVPVVTVDDAVGPLEHVDEVTLAVVRPDGTPATIAAHAAEGGVEDAERFTAPFLFEHRRSSVGVAFGFGPLDSLFWWNDIVAHVPTTHGRLGCSAYEARSAWGILCNIIRVQHRAAIEGGARTTRVTLFGLIDLGGD